MLMMSFYSVPHIKSVWRCDGNVECVTFLHQIRLKRVFTLQPVAVKTKDKGTLSLGWMIVAKISHSKTCAHWTKMDVALQIKLNKILFLIKHSNDN